MLKKLWNNLRALLGFAVKATQNDVALAELKAEDMASALVAARGEAARVRGRIASLDEEITKCSKEIDEFTEGARNAKLAGNLIMATRAMNAVVSCEAKKEALLSDRDQYASMLTGVEKTLEQLNERNALVKRQAQQVAANVAIASALETANAVSGEVSVDGQNKLVEHSSTRLHTAEANLALNTDPNEELRREIKNSQTKKSVEERLKDL